MSKSRLGKTGGLILARIFCACGQASSAVEFCWSACLTAPVIELPDNKPGATTIAPPPAKSVFINSRRLPITYSPNNCLLLLSLARKNEGLEQYSVERMESKTHHRRRREHGRSTEEE